MAIQETPALGTRVVVDCIPALHNLPPDREFAGFDRRCFDGNANVEGEGYTGELALVEAVAAEVEGGRCVPDSQVIMLAPQRQDNLGMLQLGCS
jgi:hypothetical protein